MSLNNDNEPFLSCWRVLDFRGLNFRPTVDFFPNGPNVRFYTFICGDEFSVEPFTGLDSDNKTQIV